MARTTPIQPFGARLSSGIGFAVRPKGLDRGCAFGRRSLLSAALTWAIPVLYVLAFACFWRRTGDSDWDQVLSFHQIELWNASLSSVAKHWNPLMRGGMSLAGDPQVPVLSLSVLLARVFPAAAAIKLSCLVFLATGWSGAWLLSRRFGLDRKTALLAASLFAGNGYIVSRFSHGHVDFLGTLTLPLWMWALAEAADPHPTLRRLLPRGWITGVLAGGIVFFLSSDGSPISTLLLLLWVGFEAVIIGIQWRTLRPVLFFACSVLIAALLDAVFFFPMAANQFDFPRHRPVGFLDPLVFLWFLILPVRGNLLPAPANGHEFSLYIGPVLAFLMVRYRGAIARALPRSAAARMAGISAFVLLLGLGSLRGLGWSRAPLLPFDLLHRLPGFRSVGLPARLWGYLAVPGALAGAVAIRAFERSGASSARRRAIGTGLLVFNVGFQAVSIAQPFLSTRGRTIVAPAAPPARIERIANRLAGSESQAAALRPDRGLLDAYNDHDFIQGAIAAGDRLLAAVRPSELRDEIRGRWDGWSSIVVEIPAGPPTSLVLNQNFHSHWSASAGVVTRNARGNLCLRVRERSHPLAVRLRFCDPWSERGLQITRMAWAGVVFLLAGLLLSDGLRPWTRARLPERAWLQAGHAAETVTAPSGSHPPGVGLTAG